MKYLNRILIVVGLFGVAAVAGKLSDWTMGRPPPTPPAVPSGTSLVEGGTAKDKKQKALPLAFDVLKKWTYVEGKTPIPGFIRVFEGKPVVMTGYMMPLSDIKDVKSFVLVPSLWGCCYGQPPAANHIVLVKMAGGATAKFFDDQVKVRGIFHCGEERQDGFLVSLYRIDADEVAAK